MLFLLHLLLLFSLVHHVQHADEHEADGAVVVEAFISLLLLILDLFKESAHLQFVALFFRFLLDRHDVLHKAVLLVECHVRVHQVLRLLHIVLFCQLEFRMQLLGAPLMHLSLDEVLA